MEIIWLPSATEDLISLLNRVDDLFGSSVSIKVNQKIMSHVYLLSSFPYMGMRDSRFSSIEIRYLVNTPNVIYYTLFENRVIILSIFNSKQSPENIQRMLADILKANGLL